MIYHNGIEEDVDLQMSPADEVEWLKNRLAESDYKVLQYIEGTLSLEEYEQFRKNRAEWRERIRVLTATK